MYTILTFINEQHKSAKIRRCVLPPTRVTLGRCVQQFWELNGNKEEMLCQKINRIPSGNTFINEGIQTDLQTIEKCDSCEETVQFLKDIVNYLAENDPLSTTKKYMDLINDNIFNMTKFGTTLKLSSSLKMDYQNLVKKLHDAVETNKCLVQNISDIELELTKRVEETKQLTESERSYSDQIEMVDEELNSAVNYIETLEEEQTLVHQRNEECEVIVENLENRIKLMETEIMECKEHLKLQLRNEEKSINDHKREINLLRTSNQVLKLDMEKLCTKFAELFGKYSTICKVNFKFEQNIEEVYSTIDNLDGMADRINENVKRTVDRVTSLSEKMKQLQQNYNEQKGYIEKIIRMRQSFENELKIKRKSDDTDQSEIQGDPLIDISRQMKKNEDTIRDLQHENRKFEVILKVYQRKLHFAES